MLRRRPTHSEQYKAHLQSPEWARIRRKALEHSGHSCALCGLDQNALRRIGRHLEVHHRHYRSLGHERPEDLTVLCAGGHGGCHALADQQRRAANASSTRAPARATTARRKHRGRSRRRRRHSARRAFTVPLGILTLAYAGIALAGAILPHTH